MLETQHEITENTLLFDHIQGLNVKYVKILV